MLHEVLLVRFAKETAVSAEMPPLANGRICNTSLVGRGVSALNACGQMS